MFFYFLFKKKKEIKLRIFLTASPDVQYLLRSQTINLLSSADDASTVS